MKNIKTLNAAYRAMYPRKAIAENRVNKNIIHALQRRDHIVIKDGLMKLNKNGRAACERAQSRAIIGGILARYAEQEKQGGAK